MLGILALRLWKGQALRHTCFAEALNIAVPLPEGNKRDAEEDVEVSRIHGGIYSLVTWSHL